MLTLVLGVVIVASALSLAVIALLLRLLPILFVLPPLSPLLLMLPSGERKEGEKDDLSALVRVCVSGVMVPLELFLLKDTPPSLLATTCAAGVMSLQVNSPPAPAPAPAPPSACVGEGVGEEGEGSKALKNEESM